MLFMVRPDTKAVHRLADLLETIGVAADELLDQKFAGHDRAAIRAMTAAELQEQLAGLRRFVSHIRSLELAIVAKLSQARDNARLVARTDWRLRPIMMLFTAGTQAFADRFLADAADRQHAFDGASQVFPFLRSRGLVSEATLTYDGSGDLLVTDSFRLLGSMQLRDLLERCEATLNALDAHYDLYELDNDEEEAAAEEAEPVVELPAALAASAPAPAGDNGSSEALKPAEAINWGESLPPAPSETPALPAAAGTATAPEPLAEGILPAVEEVAAAQAASEAGLKSLTDRLAEMKATAPEDAAAAPTPKASAA